MAKKQDCLFCKIAKGKIPVKKVKDSDNFFAILDANPVAKGHTLVIPKKHLVTLLDIPNTLGSELLKSRKKSRCFSCGMNCGNLFLF